LKQSLEKDTAMSTILRRATDSVIQAVPHGGETEEELQVFLASPEVESIVRQIYSSQLSKNGSDQSGRYTDYLR
jgi:hypothetical protein